MKKTDKPDPFNKKYYNNIKKKKSKKKKAPPGGIVWGTFYD